MNDLFGPVPTVTGALVVANDWPHDYAMQFWDRWPPHFRKYGKPQVFKKLSKIREEGETSWAQVFGGLAAFIASNPETKFIPAPLVWLNQARWTANYEPPKPTKMTLGDIMRGGIARHG